MKFSVILLHIGCIHSALRLQLFYCLQLFCCYLLLLISLPFIANWSIRGYPIVIGTFITCKRREAPQEKEQNYFMEPLPEASLSQKHSQIQGVPKVDETESSRKRSDPYLGDWLIWPFGTYSSVLKQIMNLIHHAIRWVCGCWKSKHVFTTHEG